MSTRQANKHGLAGVFTGPFRLPLLLQSSTCLQETLGRPYHSSSYTVLEEEYVVDICMLCICMYM